MPKKQKSDHDEKSLYRHTIPSFASSKSPFWLQLGSRETYASHLETKAKRCLRHNQRRAARAAWVRCEPFIPRRDSKTDELALSSWRHAQSFFLKAITLERTIGHVCKASFVIQAEKKQRVPCKPPGERELGVVRLAKPIHERIWSGAHH